MAQRITTAVRVQLTTVSKNTSKIAHCPWTPGSPSAAPLRTARLPSPASLEKTPRAIPYWTLLLARSPAAPPAALRNENVFFLLYIFALIFSAIATGWVKVEDDITTYLPDTTETRQGLTVMNDNFVTYGTANVMVSNITYDTALDIQSRLEDIEGVTTVEFDDTDEHYTNASALFSVSFDAEVGDERAENALQEIRDELEGSYDTSIYSEVGYDSSADLQSEMVVIVIIAAIIIVVVLTLTSRSYAEVPVLIMTFGAAIACLNEVAPGNE